MVFDKKTRDFIRFVKWINNRYPRNGDADANDRAVKYLSLKICRDNESLMKRLAEN